MSYYYPAELEPIHSTYLDLLARPQELSVCSSSINGQIYKYLAPDDPNDRLLRRLNSLRTVSDIHWDAESGKSAVGMDPGDTTNKGKSTDPGDSRPCKRHESTPTPHIPTDLGIDDDAQVLNRKVSWGPVF